MSPSIFLGIDKSTSPTSVHNQLRRKRDVVAKHVDSSQLKKFDTLLQKPLSWDALFNWGDQNKIWIGSREDFQEYNPVSESDVDKDGHMKLSPKQQKIAAMAGNRKKIDAPDFAALRAMRKNGKAKDHTEDVEEAKMPKCTCGTDNKGKCKRCSMKTESRAEQVVNRLVGENVMDLLKAAGSDMASELDADDDGSMDMHAHDHDETDMSNPEERTEVDIANEILDTIDNESIEMEERHATVRELAHELLAIHGQDSSDNDDESSEDSDDDDFEEVR
jgi:hypothetical protein